MNREMMEKLLEAERLQKEVFKTLLPKSVAVHMENIKKECSLMLFECLMEMGKWGKQEEPEGDKKAEKTVEKGVKKVVIE